MVKPLPDLLLPNSMPVFPGLRVPHDLYWVLDRPALLAGMAYPSWPPLWDHLFSAGFRHIVCLTRAAFPYDPAPLHGLRAVQLEDLVGGRQPAQPEEQARRVRAAASAVLEKYLAGEGVVVHCAGGTGRTGAVLGCVLRSLGYPGAQVLRYLDRLNRARGQDGWPESGWQASLVEEYLP